MTNKSIATDDSGFVNNVVTVKAAHHPLSAAEESSLPIALPAALKSELEVSMPKLTPRPSQTSLVSVPEHKERESEATEQPAKPVIPSLVIEKVDGNPSHGDDFGPNATAAQKLAHELRAADAEPDEVVVSPVEPSAHTDNYVPDAETVDSELDAAPLFPHEAETESETSSHSQQHTDAEEEDPDMAPLFTHETLNVNDHEDGASDNEGTSSEEWTLNPAESHFRGFGITLDNEDDEPEGNELDNGPLFQHEVIVAESNVANDELTENELDHSPLFSHETGFFQNINGSRGHSVQTAQGNNDLEDGTFESERAPTFPHEALEHEDTEAPLLPHERSSLSSSEDLSHEAVSGSVHEEDAPTFAYESSRPALPWSPARARSNEYFLRRTSGQPMTSSLAASTVRDDDPNDPSLEPFPTGRDEILERVATISHRLPEDETLGTSPSHAYSPATSQACSSTDNLAPLGHISSTHLNAVEEDEEELSDTDDLPELRTLQTKQHPVANFSLPPFTPATAAGLMGHYRVEDNDKTPLAEYPPVIKVSPAEQSLRNIDAKQKPTSPSQHDGGRSTDDTVEPKTAPSKESPEDGSVKNPTITISPAPVEPLTPPQTPEKKGSYKPSESQQRARSATPVHPGNLKDDKAKEGVLKWLYRVLLGSWLVPLGRLLSSLFGGKNEAR